MLQEAGRFQQPVLLPDVYKHSLRGHSWNWLLGLLFHGGIK